jgi:hypothetical protein
VGFVVNKVAPGQFISPSTSVFLTTTTTTTTTTWLYSPL